MSRSTQLDHIAELTQHDLGPGASVTCSPDPRTGYTLFTFRSGGEALCVHLSAQCTAKFSRLEDSEAKDILRELFEDFGG